MSGKKNQSRTDKTTPVTSTPKQRLNFSSAGKPPITVKLPTSSIARDVIHTKKPLSATRNTNVSTNKSDARTYQGQTPGDLQGTPTPSRVQEAQVKREIKLLRKETEEIKAELSYIKTLYNQLVDEQSQENFDERRICLLKSQVIQLERQVVLFSSALSARKDMLTEVEVQLIRMRDQLGMLKNQSMSPETISDSLADLERTVEGMRQYLYKTTENTNLESLHLPAIVMGKFLKQSTDTEPELTLLDICSGKIEHLNLKHVSKLESKLCKLYKQMTCLQETLRHSSTSISLNSEHVGQPIRERLADHVTTTTNLLQEACQDLLTLSILVPSAPWPPLRKPLRPDLTIDNVMSHMPAGLSRKKEQEIHSVLDALMKAVSYNRHMMALEGKILKEELSFHQNVYDVQVKYAEALLESVRSAYSQFEKNTLDLLCRPLVGILDSYENLKTTTSEEALRDFLTQFKDNSEKLADAVECLQEHASGTSRDETADPLSQYGQHFFHSLNELIKECATKRDSLMSEILKLKSVDSESVPVTSESASKTESPRKDDSEESNRTCDQS